MLVSGYHFSLSKQGHWLGTFHTLTSVATSNKEKQPGPFEVNTLPVKSFLFLLSIGNDVHLFFMFPYVLSHPVEGVD